MRIRLSLASSHCSQKREKILPSSSLSCWSSSGAFECLIPAIDSNRHQTITKKFCPRTKQRRRNLDQYFLRLARTGFPLAITRPTREAVQANWCRRRVRLLRTCAGPCWTAGTTCARPAVLGSAGTCACECARACVCPPLNAPSSSRVRAPSRARANARCLAHCALYWCTQNLLEHTRVITSGTTKKRCGCGGCGAPLAHCFFCSRASMRVESCSMAVSTAAAGSCT